MCLSNILLIRVSRLPASMKKSRKKGDQTTVYHAELEIIKGVEVEYEMNRRVCEIAVEINTIMEISHAVLLGFR